MSYSWDFGGKYCFALVIKLWEIRQIGPCLFTPKASFTAFGLDAGWGGSKDDALRLRPGSSGFRRSGMADFASSRRGSSFAAFGFRTERCGLKAGAMHLRPRFGGQMSRSLVIS